jgi:NAD-dependent deacetylase
MPTKPIPPPPSTLIEQVRIARRIVVLTGAGMSAESGIPTFRDKLTGLWARYDAEKLATREAFQRDPATVWAWYEWRRRLVARCEPNLGHQALRALGALSWLEDLSIVTQNVDNLHERAGSTSVIHLHGSLFAPRCFDCARPFEGFLDSVGDSDEPETSHLAPPRCVHCGGNVRPGVVWFGEALPEGVWLQAMALVEKADLLLVIGTSGRVYPAASLPSAARREGCDVAVINPDLEVATASQDVHWNVSAAIGLPALLQAVAGDGQQAGRIGAP